MFDLDLDAATLSKGELLALWSLCCSWSDGNERATTKLLGALLGRGGELFSASHLHRHLRRLFLAKRSQLKRLLRCNPAGSHYWLHEPAFAALAGAREQHFRCVERGVPCEKACRCMNTVDSCLAEVRPAAGMGEGVFAVKEIEKGAWISEYKGFPTKRGGDYVVTFRYTPGLMIDGAAKDCLGHFINHSCSDKQINCLFWEVGRRLFVQAARDIAPGEQLFLHYGYEYWSKRKPCKCIECIKK